MLTVSSLIEFLMNLLRDEAAQAEFERDPHGTLAAHGLDDLCGQDVRDAAPMVADQAGVSAPSGAHTQGGAPSSDPVREIVYIKDNYTVDDTVVVDESDTYNYNYSYVEDNSVNIDVDDRDTTTIQADGDVTITDSFNQDNDVTVVQDSFNEDNDGVDNKGGTIDDSVAAGDDIDDSFDEDNDTTDTTVEDSGNEDNDGADTDVTVADGSTSLEDGLDEQSSSLQDEEDLQEEETILEEEAEAVA